MPEVRMMVLVKRKRVSVSLAFTHELFAIMLDTISAGLNAKKYIYHTRKLFMLFIRSRGNRSKVSLEKQARS